MDKKILIVDDDLNLVDVLKVEFEACGYAVIGAGDGVDALEKIRAEKPDVVIADIEMPKMSGYTLVREMKSDDALKNIPIIIITGKDHMEELFKVEGIKDYFVKPLEFDGLLSKTEELLGVPQSKDINAE